MWIKDHSRSFKIKAFDRSYTTFYYSVIIGIASSCIILELLDVQE